MERIWEGRGRFIIIALLFKGSDISITKLGKIFEWHGTEETNPHVREVFLLFVILLGFL